MLKKIAIPAVVLTVICAVITALLAGTNLLTRDSIEQQEQLRLAQTRRQALSEAERFEEVASEDGAVLCRGLNAAGEPCGFVAQTAAKGYGGEVTVVTGFSGEGRITAVVLLSHSETPGLGAKAEGEEFRSQFAGKAADQPLTVKKSAAGDADVQAISGATITSRAVTSAVNQAMALYTAYAEGGKS